jgi:hypothetical protein
VASEGLDGSDVKGFISTGSYSFNALLSGSIHGGIPDNKIVALAGEQATGKTYFALNVVREFLNSDPKAMVLYFDTEQAITSDLLRGRGIDTDRVISATFLIGGFLGGAASVMWSVYNNTISFQMGFRAGMDAFTAAVLGGIGSLPGAMVGGVLIGLIRAMSDQYIETRWTNVVVFSVLILILVFRPSGLLGLKQREKV